MPERGGFQARGSGFLWSRARKGTVLGTDVVSFALASISVPLEDEDFQRSGKRQFNYVGPLSEVVV